MCKRLQAGTNEASITPFTDEEAQRKGLNNNPRSQGHTAKVEIQTQVHLTPWPILFPLHCPCQVRTAFPTDGSAPHAQHLSGLTPASLSIPISHPNLLGIPDPASDLCICSSCSPACNILLYSLTNCDLFSWPSTMSLSPKPSGTLKSESEVVQSCLTLCDPMDCSLPGSSVHGFSRQ